MKQKMICAFKFALSIVGLLFVTLEQASAGPITIVPSSLSPGDTYRLAFLTSDTIDATSADINVYNNFVDGLGDLVIASEPSSLMLMGIGTVGLSEYRLRRKRKLSLDLCQ